MSVNAKLPRISGLLLKKYVYFLIIKNFLINNECNTPVSIVFIRKSKGHMKILKSNNYNGMNRLNILGEAIPAIKVLNT